MAKTRVTPRRLRPVLSRGERLAVRFSGMAPDGAAIAVAKGVTLEVRYAIPGEEAVVEIRETFPAPRGAIVALRRKSPDATAPRCPHFGRCGGCQWQHVGLEAQRRHKRTLVASALEAAGVVPAQVRACMGGEGWQYRSVLRAAFGRRGDAVIGGFHVWGEQRLLDIETCPVQHPTNVRILDVVREAVRALRLPVLDLRTGKGLVRGVVAMTGFATGEALAVLGVAEALPDRAAMVRALLDRVPGLIGILQSVVPGRTAQLLGGRLDLLWGRAYVEDEIAGLRLRLDPRMNLIPSPRDLPLLVQAVAEAGRLRGDEQLFDAFAESGFLPLALAGRVHRAIGVVADRDLMTEAWATATRSGIANAVFYTRDPARVLQKLQQRGERTDVLVASPPGEGLPETFQEALPAAGPGRMVYVGRSLAASARDLPRLRRAGYVIEYVQPVDLHPQTSRVHTVVALHRT